MGKVYVALHTHILERRAQLLIESMTLDSSTMHISGGD